MCKGSGGGGGGGAAVAVAMVTGQKDQVGADQLGAGHLQAVRLAHPKCPVSSVQDPHLQVVPNVYRK